MALAWGAAAWIAGVVAAALLGAAAWPIGLACAAIGFVVAILRADVRLAAAALALALVFLAGAWRFASVDSPPAAHDVSRFNGGVAMRIRGEVRDDPRIADTSQSVVVAVEAVQRAGSWEPVSGAIEARTALLPPLRRGDLVELVAELEEPQRSSDGFDYAAYLALRGVRSVASYPEITIAGHRDGNPLEDWIDRVRGRLSHALAVSLPEPHASLAHGLVLGEKSALDSALRGNLNATNTAHLVVVSGANIVLVSAMTVTALAWLVGRRRALWASIAVILAYMLLVGVAPPVVRGTIMGILLVVAQCSGRRTTALISVGVAAALMIAVSPPVIHDVSFQLSFAATAGIAALSAPLHRWIVDAACWITRRETVPRAFSGAVAGPLATTLAAIIATEPLIALNFGRLSLVAVPANMLIVPFFPVILGASALAALGGLLPAGHALFAAPAYYALSYWIAVADALAALPASSVTVGGLSAWWAAAAYAVIALAGLMFVRGGRERPAPRIDAGTSRWPLVPLIGGAAGAALFIVATGFVSDAGHNQRLTVTFLDVGQGDATLIETPGGADVLVDGGPGRAVIRELGGELPWYDRDIELVVLTHAQSDHMVGLLDVFDRFAVGRVLTGDMHGASEVAVAAWSAAVEREGAAARHLVAGDVVDLGAGVRLEVLGPTPAIEDGEVNDRSLVMRIVWRDVSFLLAGDVEVAGERALLASGADLASTVLKVPHHGSKTSSSDAFLAAVKPSLSVISAGANNQYGHPHAEVVRRLAGHGRVLSTASVGRIRIETDGHDTWVATEQ